MVNSIDLDQISAEESVWSVSALFAYAILSETLVYEFLAIYRNNQMPEVKTLYPR